MPELLDGVAGRERWTQSQVSSSRGPENVGQDGQLPASPAKTLLLPDSNAADDGGRPSLRPPRSARQCPPRFARKCHAA
jgi:hypothetical protein